jgi:hypothetical protein
MLRASSMRPRTRPANSGAAAGGTASRVRASRPATSVARSRSSGPWRRRVSLSDGDCRYTWAGLIPDGGNSATVLPPPPSRSSRRRRRGARRSLATSTSRAPQVRRASQATGVTVPGARSASRVYRASASRSPGCRARATASACGTSISQTSGSRPSGPAPRSLTSSSVRSLSQAAVTDSGSGHASARTRNVSLNRYEWPVKNTAPGVSSRHLRQSLTLDAGGFSMKNLRAPRAL